MSVRMRVVATAAALIAVGLIAGDSARAAPAHVDVYPDHPIAELGGQFLPPPPLTDAPAVDPDVGPRPPLTGDEPAWQLELPEGDWATSLAVTETGYVVRTRQDLLIGFDRDGEQRWEYEVDTYGTDEAVSPEVVLVSSDHPTDDRWPQPEVIVALDPATGEQLWEEREASFWSLFDGVVYMSVCYGGQDGELGECQLSARNPLTNAVRWSVPTYASAQVMGSRSLGAPPVPGYLAVESYPTGYESRTVTTLDPDTGRQLGAGFDGSQGYVPFPDLLVSVEDHDDNPADGCTATLTGYDLHSGRRAWRYVAATPKTSDGVYCGDQPDPDTSSGQLAVTTEAGRPAVLDAGSGRIEWTGPEQGRGMAASAELLLALGESGDGSDEFVLYELASGEQSWTAPAPPGGLDAAVILDRMVLTIWEGRAPVGYDLRTGDWWSYGGSDEYDPYLSFGPGWLAVCLEGQCRGYEVG